MLYDIATLVQKLEADQDNAPPDLAWLHASTREPAAFWQALLDWHAAAHAPRARTRRLADRCELYADMVIRHLDRPNPALRSLEHGALRDLSYPDLHARSTALAGAWAGQKVKAGDVLAVVLPIGSAWLVALLTALRMGLIVSWLPPLGDRWLQKRLAGLGPKHVATEPRYLPILGKFEKMALADGPPENYGEKWHAYAPEDVAALLFTPLREPLDKPLKLPAQTAYLRALRDAVFAYRLDPGAAIAAPGFDDLQHQPALVFASLLAGATFVHLEVADVAADPKRFCDLSLRAVGLGAAVRDVLLAQRPRRKGTWEHWFKNPEEPLDVDAIRAFTKALGLEKTPSSNVVVEAAAGGVALFSARRKGAADLRLLPAAGVPFSLYDLNGSGDEAPGAVGLFAEKPAEKPAVEGHVILSQAGSEFLYAGTLAPRRDGRVYPADEVAEAVADLSFVEGAFALPVVSGGTASRALFVLLVFTGAEPPGDTASRESARKEAIERQITVCLGKGALPDRMIFYPLYPRLAEGKLDKRWCETQYRTGLLGRKARSPVFAALTALRKGAVVDPAREERR